MIDRSSYQNDRLRDTGRWGYAGEPLEDPMPVEESSNTGHWLLWAAVIVLVLLALVMLSGVFAI